MQNIKLCVNIVCFDLQENAACLTLIRIRLQVFM